MHGFRKHNISHRPRTGRPGFIDRPLKWYAPRAFDDGLRRCNELGKGLVRTEKAVNRFLDAGCGDGTLTMEFVSAVKPKEIFGIEYVDSLREQAESKGISCIKNDLNGAWGFDDCQFDLILSSQSIEHLHNTRGFLEECHRCLAPGGQLIVLTENLASWINIGALLFGWLPFSTTNVNGWSLGNPLIWHIDEPKDSDFLERWQKTGVSGLVGHVRVLAFRGLRDLLERTGFIEVELLTTGYLPLYGRPSEIMCRLDRRHGQFLVASGFRQARS